MTTSMAHLAPQYSHTKQHCKAATTALLDTQAELQFLHSAEGMSLKEAGHSNTGVAGGAQGLQIICQACLSVKRQQSA